MLENKVFVCRWRHVNNPSQIIEININLCFSTTKIYLNKIFSHYVSEKTFPFDFQKFTPKTTP